MTANAKNPLVFHKCARCGCLHRSGNPFNFPWGQLQELRACSQCSSHEFVRTEMPDDFETAAYPFILPSTGGHKKCRSE
jgi:hypothetical protein